MCKVASTRVVFIDQLTVDALLEYLAVRGPASSDHVFVNRHQPFDPGYCGRRLREYGQRCGIHITAHQLRHTFATLLVNTGAPVTSVQAMLGHDEIETTLGYARLYDRKVAEDFARAVAEAETRLDLSED